MKITISYLNKINACNEAIEEFKNQKETNNIKLLDRMIDTKNIKYLNWANWLIARLLNKKQRIQYAIYAAEQVLYIFEKKYPNDDRPRKAINVAKKYLKYPIKKNKDAAQAAADAAQAAYAYARVAFDAVYAAQAAAYTAQAVYAVYAAQAVAYAAQAAAYAYARVAMKIEILKYGIILLKGNKR